MYIKHAILCYVQYCDFKPLLRLEIELLDEPTSEQISEAFGKTREHLKRHDNDRYERRIFVVVEKRIYDEELPIDSMFRNFDNEQGFYEIKY